MRVRRSKPSSKRRTTLTLPVESLREAERLARARNVQLSTVVSEALAEGLRLRHTARQSDRILQSYRQAFAGFTETEMMLLDGVVLEPEPDR